ELQPGLSEWLMTLSKGTRGQQCSTGLSPQLGSSFQLLWVQGPGHKFKLISRAMPTLLQASSTQPGSKDSKSWEKRSRLECQITFGVAAMTYCSVSLSQATSGELRSKARWLSSFTRSRNIISKPNFSLS